MRKVLINTLLLSTLFGGVALGDYFIQDAQSHKPVAMSTVSDGADATKGAKADSVCGTSTGTCSVVALLKFIAQSVSSALPLGTAGGWTPLKLAALSNTAVAIKASAGQLGKVYCSNADATHWAYFQVFNVASGSVTVGTTASVPYGIPPASSSGFTMGPVGDQYSTAISAAATSTATNGTAPTTAIDCTVSYN
jgi:hypothetical protein